MTLMVIIFLKQILSFMPLIILKNCRSIQKSLRENVFDKSEDSDVSIINSNFGSASHACVSLGYDNDLKTLVVVKEVLHSQGEYCMPLETLYEMQTFQKIKKLNSVHFQQMINVHIERNSTKIFSKHLPNSFSTLFGHQTRIDFISLKANELINAVKSLHQINIAHRDIKPNNICFDHDSRLVIIDFDCASLGSSRLTLPISTLNFRAPELTRLYQQKQQGIAPQPYNAFAADWFSVGCVIAQMFRGKPLFDDLDQDADAVATDMENFCRKLNSTEGHKELLRIVPAPFYKLLQGIFSLNPDERLNAVNSWV